MDQILGENDRDVHYKLYSRPDTHGQNSDVDQSLDDNYCDVH